jgi:hypothetical protein
MVLILEFPIASIAFILIAVSLRTLRTIKHLSVGKSFWVPILLSGIFFLAGSIITILSELGFSFITYIIEVAYFSRLLALCFLSGGIYTYSRKITQNLGKFPIPVLAAKVESSNETKSSESILKKLNEKSIEKKDNCRHQIGYLRTLQRHVQIPEECLGCDRIIECKYSAAKNAKSTQSSTITQPSPDMMLSDAVLEEENAKKDR